MHGSPMMGFALILVVGAFLLILLPREVQQIIVYGFITLLVLSGFVRIIFKKIKEKKNKKEIG